MIKGDVVDILVFFTIFFMLGMGGVVIYMVKKKI